jgi:hypothetical protein
MDTYLGHENEAKPRYFHVSIGRLIALSIFSCGVFETYWMYKNWKYIRSQTGENISPFWRAIFGVFYCRKLLKAIHDDDKMIELEAPRFSPTGLTAGWIIFIFLARAIGNADETGMAGAVVAWLMPSYLFLAPVQGYVNKINLKREVHEKHTLFSKGHILCYVIGGLLWSLLFIPLDSDTSGDYSGITIQDALYETASEINRNLPMMLDSETQLDSTIPLPNKTFMYSYTMINYVASEVDKDFFVSEMRPSLISTVSTLPEMATFRDNDVTVAYKYRGKDGAEIATIKITPEDYK